MLHLDTGNTAFMLLCSSLVMLMTPGLAFFYGGLVGRKNVLAIMIQSFVSMGWTTVLWWALGLGAGLGGNATAVGASANVVILGLAGRAGHPISFWQFTRLGLVVTAVTVVLAALYLWLRYFAFT